MRTALDSSVVLLIQKRQSGWEAWRDLLSAAAAEGQLLMCPVVFAECSIGYVSAEVAVAEFSAVHVCYDAISPAAAFLAGETFLRYRREGGPRERLIPDFLIAAHACTQADRLVTTDRGYFRRYFSDLKLLQPA